MNPEPASANLRLVEQMREEYSDDGAGGRERGRPEAPQRGCRVGPRRRARSRDKCVSASTPGSPPRGLLRGGVARWGCSRTGPALIAVDMTHTLHLVDL